MYIYRFGHNLNVSQVIGEKLDKKRLVQITKNKYKMGKQ